MNSISNESATKNAYNECWHCSKYFDKVTLCALCTIARYCSKECADNNVSSHEEKCMRWQQKLEVGRDAYGNPKEEPKPLYRQRPSVSFKLVADENGKLIHLPRNQEISSLEEEFVDLSLPIDDAINYNFI